MTISHKRESAEKPARVFFFFPPVVELSPAINAFHLFLMQHHIIVEQFCSLCDQTVKHVI